jgi:hypothetical protein
MVKKNLEEMQFQCKMSLPGKRNLVFRLLWIQSIQVSGSKRHFKALFREYIPNQPNRGMYLTEYVPLYNLRLREFYVGELYKDFRYLGAETPDGEEFEVSIDATENNRKERISHVLTDEEYNLSHSFKGKSDVVDFTEENKRQYCVVFENTERIVVFPCSVIAANYYFTSSSMVDAMFSQNLKGLYEKITFDPETGEPTILMKYGAADSDAQHIIRFANDKYAHSQWLAIKNNILRGRELSRMQGATFPVPLIADFPIKQELNIKVRGLGVWDKLRDKEKIIAFRILKEDSEFGFDAVHIQRRSKEGILGSDRKLRRTTHETTNTMTGETPSSSLAKADIEGDIPEPNIHLDKMKVTKELIREEQKPVALHTTVIGGKPVDISTKQAEHSGSQNVRPGSVYKRGLISTSVAEKHQVIGHNKTKIFHHPDSPNGKNVTKEHRVIFNSILEAKQAGYRLAKNWKW